MCDKIHVKYLNIFHDQISVGSSKIEIKSSEGGLEFSGSKGDSGLEARSGAAGSVEGPWREVGSPSTKQLKWQRRGGGLGGYDGGRFVGITI